MKVKTLACLCALAAIPAFGTEAVTSANTFGVLKVTCSATNVIIATPWVKCGDATSAVSVTDLVMTDNLAEGDEIIVYANNEFKRWVLNSSKQWVGTAVTDARGTMDSGDAASAAIARGLAFRFIKSGGYTSDSYDLFLYGQDTTATATSTITGGSSGTPAYSLVASPKTTDANLNSPGVVGFTPNAADEIRIPRDNLPDVIYTYKASELGWGTLTSQLIPGTTRYRKVWTKGCEIPAGTGFWYVSKGGSGTIKW